MTTATNEKLTVRCSARADPDNHLQPGNVWADCLCTEIDPSDTPCIVCTGRFVDCPGEEIGDEFEAEGVPYIVEFMTIKWEGDMPFWETTSRKK